VVPGDAVVAVFVGMLDQLSAELGEEVVVEACRRFLTDPQVGFVAALRVALGDLDGGRA